MHPKASIVNADTICIARFALSMGLKSVIDVHGY